jgi:hypothetical protein
MATEKNEAVGRYSVLSERRHIFTSKYMLYLPTITDLSEGRLFYEKQGEGLGEYFFDSLFSDIDSLTLYAGIHPVGQPVFCIPVIDNYTAHIRYTTITKY